MPDAFLKLLFDTHQWQSIPDNIFPALWDISNLAFDLKQFCVCVIKDAILNPYHHPVTWSRIKKLKPKTRRSNFANVSNEKTRVPLEAMSLKIRDLKRCGQVILWIWRIPIGFHHILKVPLSNWIKAWNVW